MRLLLVAALALGLFLSACSNSPEAAKAAIKAREASEAIDYGEAAATAWEAAKAAVKAREAAEAIDEAIKAGFDKDDAAWEAAAATWEAE